jgi:hypothetical protein
MQEKTPSPNAELELFEECPDEPHATTGPNGCGGPGWHEFETPEEHEKRCYA